MMRSVSTFAVIAIAMGLGLGFSTLQRKADETVNWQFSAMTGGSYSQSNVESERILINFWATWCPPCLRELPLLSELAQSTPESELRVLAIAYDEPKNINAFLAEHNIELDVGYGFADVKAAMTAFGNASSSLPFSVLLNSEGELLTKHIGELHADTLAEFVASGS